MPKKRTLVVFVDNDVKSTKYLMYFCNKKTSNEILHAPHRPVLPDSNAHIGIFAKP
jgi:hypothetical protein